jgi:hypothetical protein
VNATTRRHWLGSLAGLLGLGRRPVSNLDTPASRPAPGVVIRTRHPGGIANFAWKMRPTEEELPARCRTFLLGLGCTNSAPFHVPGCIAPPGRAMIAHYRWDRADGGVVMTVNVLIRDTPWAGCPSIDFATLKPPRAR